MHIPSLVSECCHPYEVPGPFLHTLYIAVHKARGSAELPVTEHTVTPHSTVQYACVGTIYTPCHDAMRVYNIIIIIFHLNLPLKL